MQTRPNVSMKSRFRVFASAPGSVACLREMLFAVGMLDQNASVVVITTLELEPSAIVSGVSRRHWWRFTDIDKNVFCYIYADEATSEGYSFSGSGWQQDIYPVQPAVCVLGICPCIRFRCAGVGDYCQILRPVSRSHNRTSKILIIQANKLSPRQSVLSRVYIPRRRKSGQVQCSCSMGSGRESFVEFRVCLSTWIRQNNNDSPAITKNSTKHAIARPDVP